MAKQSVAGPAEAAWRAHSRPASPDAGSAYLYAIFMQAPTIICVLRGPNHVLELANDRCIEFLGGVNLIGRPVTEIAPELVSRGLLAVLDHVYTDGEPASAAELQAWPRPRDNNSPQERYYNLVVDPIRDGFGTVNRLLLHAIDVTDQVRSRRVLSASEEEQRRQNGYLAALHETTLALMDRLDLSDLLETIVGRAAALANAKHGYIYLIEPGHDTMVSAAGVGIFNERRGLRIRFGEGVGGVVWQTGQPLSIENYSTWPNRIAGPPRDGLRAVIGVPLKSGDQVVGVIGLAHLEEGLVFGATELALVDQFARLASIALDNARLFQAARAAEEHLRRQLDFTSAITGSLGEGVLALDRAGRISFANPAARQLLGWAEAELLDRPLASLLEAPRAAAASAGAAGSDATGDALLEALQSGRAARSEDAMLLRGDQTRLPVACSVAPIVTAGEAVGAVLAFHDITEHKAHTAALEHQALYDALTGLPNRTLLHDRLQQALHSAGRDGKSLALMILDLDNFKDVNDTLGHHHGDLLLRQVGVRMREALRITDTVARLGGDEFAILLPSTNTAAAARAAEKVLKALEAHFQIDDFMLHVSASIGVAVYPDHGPNGDALLRRADVAMYLAKRRKGTCIVYNPDQDEHSPGSLTLLGDLRRALREETLQLHYQPQLQLPDGGVTSVEALVRWTHPRYGLQLPGDFIPRAEQSGLIIPLTDWVLNAAMQQCAAWRRQGLSLTVSVNLSGRSLRDAQLPETVAGALAAAGLEPAALVIELAEGTIAAEPQLALQVLTRLHELGVRLSIDGFGAGSSSLMRLKRLPVDEIKLDRAFVGRLDADEGDAIIVRATIELAHKLGRRVVASGIEDPETLAQLTALGCDAAQGYHLGYPQAADALTAVLLDGRRS